MAKVIECRNCGAIISSRNKYCPECNARIKKKKWLWLIVVPIIIILALLLFGGHGADQVMGIAQSNDEHVLGVKYGTPYDYPDITYGEAFEAFFGSPTWTYFKGTREGSDEEYDIVEFTGTCLYQTVKVTARIQFTLSQDGQTFEATYLAFNDVPQTNVLLYGLIEKAFSDYQEKQEMAAQETKP